MFQLKAMTLLKKQIQITDISIRRYVEDIWSFVFMLKVIIITNFVQRQKSAYNAEIQQIIRNLAGALFDLFLSI